MCIGVYDWETYKDLNTCSIYMVRPFKIIIEDNAEICCFIDNLNFSTAKFNVNIKE